MMRYNYGYDLGMMGYGWGWLLMAGVGILIVVGVIMLVRYLMHNKMNMYFHQMPMNNTISNALNILNERYAKGELNDEEYNKKKEELKKQ